MKEGKLFLGDVDFTFHAFDFPNFVGSPGFEVRVALGGLADCQLEDGLRSMLAFARPVLRCYSPFLVCAATY